MKNEINGIKVGEYARTGSMICKIVDITTSKYLKNNNKLCFEVDAYVNSNQELYLEDIIKHSPNLIDIIEAGDYVNGNMVIDKPTKKWLNVCTNIVGNSRVYDWGIKSIVTKEQFESVSYKVKE